MDVENVDQYQVERDGDVIVIKFMDIFGDGLAFGFPVNDARKIRDALTQVIGDRPPRWSPVFWRT